MAATQELEMEAGQVAGDMETTDALLEARQRMKKRKLRQERAEPSTLRDALGWVAIIGGIAWLLTLISFDPSDPSALNASSKMAPDNLLGKVGANIAVYCYQFLGFGSFLAPMGGIYAGVLCIRARRVPDWFFQLTCAAAVGVSFLTFLGGFPPFTLKNYPIMPGGLAGHKLWVFFSHYLNPFGTYLFLFGVVGLAILIATQLTIRDLTQFFARLSNWLLRQALALYRLLTRLLEKSAREKTREKILQRELTKINQAKQDAQRADAAPLTPPDADDGPDLAGTASLDLAAELEAPPAAPAPRKAKRATSAPKAEAAAEGDIKVHEMKRTEPAEQSSFQFVKDLQGSWTYPSSYIFNPPDEAQKLDESELVDKAKALQNKFAEFSVTGVMKEIHPGPVVTTYEFKPDSGIKYSRVVNLSEDLCLALGSESIRIDRMPGRSSIGIEAPNDKRELITFREMVESQPFQKHSSKLLFSLGKTIDGTPFYADLAKMPHLLIAGQTGSGKSVGINAMICSLLMRARPDEVKLIMIDPKMVEMSIYADIPHLLTPVVTDPHEAANSLKWAVAEMERRYRLLAGFKFRNLEHYNKAVKSGALEAEEGEEPLEPLPVIAVFIDELADLMMVARGEVEESIARLAQKSRAIGIHLVLATQRPSVDIITGVIKSNLPSRLAYRVAQKNDSRIILDANGAEKLLGKGDGLFLGPGTARLVRIHAPFLSETEVADLCKFLKNQGSPDYNHSVLRSHEEISIDEEIDLDSAAPSRKRKEDPMYDKAARLVVRSGQASVSYLQRKLSLGYARAAKLVDMMEEDGIVGPNLGSKARDILVPADYFDGVDSQLH